MWISIPTAVALLVVSIMALVKRNEGARQRSASLSIIASAAPNFVRQVQLNEPQLDLMMDFITNAATEEDRTGAIEVLKKAAADGEWIDARIAAFAIDPGHSVELRSRLLDEVIRHRGHPDAVAVVLQHARTAAERADAMAAFEAIAPVLDPTHAEELLRVIAASPHAELKEAAQSAFVQLISRSTDPKALSAVVSDAIGVSANRDARPYFDALIDACEARSQVLANHSRPRAGRNTPPARQQPPPASQTPTEVEKIVSSFESHDEAGKLKAIADLVRTASAPANAPLLGIADSDDVRMQTEAIKALISLNTQLDLKSTDQGQKRRRWIRVMWRCKTSEQRILLIDALAKFQEEWSNNLLQELARNQSDSAAASHARQVLETNK